jgi:ADP-ribose pyrophosphatase YjhB (NUDIX family)
MAWADEWCAICQEALASPAGTYRVDALACGHVFHRACLDPLVEASHSRLVACPTCRYLPARLDREYWQLPNRARVVVAFAGVPGFVLLVKDWQHRWCLPGGKLEQTDLLDHPPDPLLATAARETLEETGLRLPHDQLVFMGSEGRQAYYTHIFTHFDWVRIRDASELALTLGK